MKRRRMRGSSPDLQAVAGHGFGVVTTTGAATQYGGIAALVGRKSASSASPLQRKAGVLVRRLGVVAVIVAIALFGLSLARGEPWTRALLGAVSLAMAAIPEEFPIVLTLFLSAGAWRLASRGMLVRRLASVETLGSTTVICTDKTGTLTRGEFQMTRHLALAPVGVGAGCPGGLRACVRTPPDRRDGARDWRVRSRPRRLHRPIWTPAGRSSETTTSIRSASTCRTCGRRWIMTPPTWWRRRVPSKVSWHTAGLDESARSAAVEAEPPARCARSASARARGQPVRTNSEPIGTRTSAI